LGVRRQLISLPLRPAAFIEPMECLAVPKVPEGSEWVYEIKLDGYRALGIKSDGGVRLQSRRNNSFNRHYPLIVEALGELSTNPVFPTSACFRATAANHASISLCSIFLFTRAGISHAFH
jgi:ATP dependent DNA ligase domain